MGVGKNFIAEKILLPLLSEINFGSNTLVIAFADHFKVDCCSKENISFERVFVKKDPESRAILQKRGTEEGRNKYGDDIWTRTLENWIKVYASRGIKNFIITDVRFENEVKFVEKLGGLVIRVNSPVRNEIALMNESNGNKEIYEKISSHPSETSLDNYNFDFVIQNDNKSEESLREEVKNIIKQVYWIQ